MFIEDYMSGVVTKTIKVGAFTIPKGTRFWAAYGYSLVNADSDVVIKIGTIKCSLGTMTNLPFHLYELEGNYKI